MPAQVQISNKGQALIEFAFSSLLFIIVLKGVLLILIYIWMQVWSEHQLYQSLICLESNKSRSYCETHFKQIFKKGEFLFKLQKISWNKIPIRNTHYLKAHLVLKTPFIKNYQIKKSLRAEGKL